MFDLAAHPGRLQELVLVKDLPCGCVLLFYLPDKHGVKLIKGLNKRKHHTALQTAFLTTKPPIQPKNKDYFSKKPENSRFFVPKLQVGLSHFNNFSTFSAGPTYILVEKKVL